MRDIINVNGPQLGDRYRVRFNTKLGLGTIVNSPYGELTGKYANGETCYYIQFPHSRTKSRTVTMTCSLEDLIR